MRVRPLRRGERKGMAVTSVRSDPIQFGTCKASPVRVILLFLLSLAIAAPVTASAQMGGRFGMRGGYAHWAGGGRERGRPFFPGPAMDFARPDVWWGDQQYRARRGVRQGQLAPLGRVIEGLGRRAPGRQLDTALDYQGGRPVYRVRWITLGGRRIDYVVDAASGAVLTER